MLRQLIFVAVSVIINLFPLAATAQGLDVPMFNDKIHHSVVTFPGLPPAAADPVKEKRLAANARPTYLVEVHPGFRNRTEAEWWAGRLREQWRSQGLRDDWLLSVVSRSPFIEVSRWPATNSVDDVLGRLEALSSHQDYWKVVQERDRFKRERDSMEGVKNTAQEERNRLQTQLSNEQARTKNLEDRLTGLWVVVALMGLVLVAGTIGGLVWGIKVRQEHQNHYFKPLRRIKGELEPYLKYDPKTATRQKVEELVDRVDKLLRTFSISDSWITSFFDLMHNVRGVTEKLNEANAVDVDGVKKMAYKPLLARDLPFHTEKKNLQEDPFKFNLEVWLAIQAEYSQIATAMNVLGEDQVNEAVHRLERNLEKSRGLMNHEPSRSELAEFLAAVVLLRKYR